MRRLQLVENDDLTDDTAIPGGLRVAFTTQDMHRVDAHFGSARALMIYEVGRDEFRLIEAVEFDTVSGESGQHSPESDDRIKDKIDAIRGCAMLFTLAIGGGAAARVVNARIYPLKLPRPESIPDVVARIQAMMRGTPPPWLRKMMQGGDSGSLDFAEA